MGLDLGGGVAGVWCLGFGAAAGEVVFVRSDFFLTRGGCERVSCKI